jgi:hypothetical protein
LDQLTPANSGASLLALNIAKRICSLDVIAQRPWPPDYDHAAFTAEIARMVDHEVNKGIIDPDGANQLCEDCGRPCGEGARFHDHSFWTCGCVERKDAPENSVSVNDVPEPDDDDPSTLLSGTAFETVRKVLGEALDPD